MSDARHRRSGPITSAACSVPAPAPGPRGSRARRDLPRRPAAIEDDASARQSGCRRRSGSVVTDGEFRRPPGTWTSYTRSRACRRPTRTCGACSTTKAGDIEFTPSAIKVTGKLGWTTRSSARRFEFLRDTAAATAPEATPKLTIPRPAWSTTAAGQQAIDETVYPDVGAFWEDLGAAYRNEVRRLAALGCRYLQFDDTSLAYLNDRNSARRSPGAARTPTTSTRPTYGPSTGPCGTGRPG